MQIKKQQLEPDMEQQTGSKLGKEYIKAVYFHPAYLTYMQSISCKILGWMKHKLEQRSPGEISITQICRWLCPYGRKQRRTKPLDESERGEWESWLKTQHSKAKIVASGPITSWQRDGETMETVTDFISLGSKITADGDSSHEIKRNLLLGRKAMTNLVQFNSVAQLCLTLWPHRLQHARLTCSSPLLELTQTHVHWVGDTIQPSHPLSSPSPPAFSLSQHQGFF